MAEEDDVEEWLEVLRMSLSDRDGVILANEEDDVDLVKPLVEEEEEEDGAAGELDRAGDLD